MLLTPISKSFPASTLEVPSKPPKYEYFDADRAPSGPERGGRITYEYLKIYNTALQDGKQIVSIPSNPHTLCSTQPEFQKRFLRTRR